MAKIFKGDVNFGFVINQTGAQPLDSRSVVQNYEELLKSETFGTAIYNGMTVATIDEQKVYMLVDKTKATIADGWKEVGAGGAVAVDTYAEAVVLATNDNIGQVIYVKTSDDTYEQAPYIVTGKGKLQKLAASNSDGTGVEADVKKLQETVGDAENGLVKEVGLKVNTSDFETYKGTVNSYLAAKANAQDLSDHTTNTNIHVTLEDKGKWNNAEKNATDYADANFVKKEGYVAYSDAEKTKLAGVAEGAQVNVLVGVKVNNVDLSIGDDKKVNIDLSAYAKSANVYSKTDADSTFLKSADYKEYDDTEVRELITNAQNAADAAQGGVNAITADYLKSTDKTELEGKITAEATARGTLKTELEGKITKAQQDAEKVATDFNTAMNTRMTTVEGKVADLEAIDHEQLMTNAINEWANQVTEGDTVDTFKELIDYAASHSSEYSELAGEVQGMKTSKADKDALDTLNAIVGKASVEGGESGSGLVKRIEDLEGIDHDAYKAADATLKSELQVEIDKKATIVDLNGEVSAREALALLVGTRTEGDTDDVFTKLSKLVAKDSAQDEVIATKADKSVVDTKAAQSDLEALASLVGTRAEGDTAASGIFADLATLVAKDVEHTSAIDALKALTVNEKAIVDGAIVLDAGDIALEESIMSDDGKGGKVEQYPSTNSIQAVLQSLNNRITAAVSGGLTSVAAGDGIAVTDVIGNSQTVSIKLSAVENNAVELKTDGIFVQAITIDGNDIE